MCVVAARIYCGLRMKCHPRAHVFEHLVPSWWDCLERLWNLWEVEPVWRKDPAGVTN